MKYLYAPDFIDKDKVSKTRYPHIIMPEIVNKENLFQNLIISILRDEIVDWLNDNVGNKRWFFKPGSHFILFVDKEDAMGFLLRWS